MITVGLIVCDSDYQNCENILKQINDRVCVEHEVIIIDNRDEFKDEKVSYEPTFSFGYNAYQLQARKKILELAKGDYIWFIDGDDEVLGLDKFDYEEDIVAYNVMSYTGKDNLVNGVIEENICSNDTLNSIRGALWNKIIKKSCFDGYDEVIPDYKAVTMEDTLFLIYAMTKAKTVRTCKDVIYYHTRGISNLQVLTDMQPFEHLIIGYNKTIEILHKILADYEDFCNDYERQHRDYLYGFIEKSQLQLRKSNPYKLTGELTLRLSELVNLNTFRDELYNLVLSKVQTKECYDYVRGLLQERYGEDFTHIVRKCKNVRYDDELKKEVIDEIEYVEEIIFSSPDDVYAEPVKEEPEEEKEPIEIDITDDDKFIIEDEK